MEQFISNSLMNKDMEFFCLGGSRYAGRVTGVGQGVITITWEGKTTYIAADKIVALWAKEEKERVTPSLGFASH